MEKDWSGNSRSVFACLGASNHSKQQRESNDYYATDPIALERLAIRIQLPRVICEPACGGGHLAKWLEDHGHKVYASDIVDRGYGEVKDFFTMNELPWDCKTILTNPPYKYALEFVLHALNILPDYGLCMMFLKTTFLESKIRYQRLFKESPPCIVAQCIQRVQCPKNGDFKNTNLNRSAQAYAWFIWQKSERVINPRILWI